MKKLLKIVIGIVVVFVLGIITIFYLTSGMTKTATAFFSAIKQHDLATARSYLSEDFKASTSEADLEDFLSHSALVNFKDTTWSNRQISGGRGELNGEVTTSTGGVIPLKLMFVKENDSWKIYGIQKPTAGLQAEESSPTVPSKPDQIALVKRSMHDFAISVNEKSMEHFFGTVAQLWKREATAQKFDESFRSFYDSGLDLTLLDRYEPTLEPVSQLSDNKILTLKGVFATRPNEVRFEQQYIFEGIAWRLVGFNVHVGKPE